MLSLLGINDGRIFVWVFALGGMLAGAAAALFMLPGRSIFPGMGGGILIDCFIIIIVGGLGSLKGALSAALLLGLVDSVGLLISPWLVEAFPYALMCVILLLRPTGFFGKPVRI
jgi:branched-subunit amino acid ABC-type transport system permease component